MLCLDQFARRNKTGKRQHILKQSNGVTQTSMIPFTTILHLNIPFSLKMKKKNWTSIPIYPIPPLSLSTFNHHHLYLFVFFVDVNRGISLVSLPIWPMNSPGQLWRLLWGFLFGRWLGPGGESGQFWGSSLRYIVLLLILLVL